MNKETMNEISALGMGESYGGFTCLSEWERSNPPGYHGEYVKRFEGPDGEYIVRLEEWTAEMYWSKAEIIA